jgi:tRNA (guanine-N7-)-methyltransferase
VRSGPGETSRGRPRYYGRRLGRSLRSTQRDLLASCLPTLGLALPEEGQQLDPRLLFPSAPIEIWLEIGFGAGEHLIGQALAHPEIGCIGCEPYINGVATLLARARKLALDRIRVFPDQACLLLDRLQAASIDRVFILFSDPWPKRRHHRRRVIRPQTVASLSRILRPGGELLFATDDMNYARWTLALLTDDDAWRWCARTAADWRSPPAGWVPTRYQQKALARNAACVYLCFQRLLSVRDPQNT